MPLSKLFDKKITKNKYAERYSVYAEGAEAVLLHEVHKEVDNEYRHEEGYHDANEQKKELKRSGGKTRKNEL